MKKSEKIQYRFTRYLPYMNAISYGFAGSATDFEQGRKLFEEYAQSIGIDLSFQDFDKELITLHEQYNEPAGALLLAFAGSTAVGCAGIRRLDEETAELKRMYIRGEFRGHGIGVQILERSLQKAIKLGYKKVRLDTLKTMEKAQALYRSFGFYEIPSYRFNPLEGTIYMEKAL